MADVDPFAEFADPPAPAAAEADPFAEFADSAEPPTEDPAPLAAGPAGLPQWNPLADAPGAKPVGFMDKAAALTSGLASGAAGGFDVVQDYAGALGDQVTGALTGRDNTFDESLEMQRAARHSVEKAAPGYNTVGKIAGTVGSAFATGGFGGAAAGRAVGGVVSGAKALLASRTAAQAAALGMPVAAGVVRQGLFARAIGAITGLAVEGAVAGGTLRAASELDDALERGDYTGLAEKVAHGVLEDAKSGAAWNVALGGALGVGGAALKKLPSLADFASGRAFKAVADKSNIKAYRLADARIKGGPQAVGRTLLDDGYVKAGDSLEDVAGKLEVGRELLGRALGDARAEVGELGAVPSASGLWDQIQAKVIAPLASSPIKRRIAETLEKRLAPLREELTANRPKPAELDSLGMEVARPGLDGWQTTLRAPTAEELAMRASMKSARAPAGAQYAADEVARDSMGMPIGRSIGEVVPEQAPWKITGSKGEAPTLVPEGIAPAGPADEITFDRLTKLRRDIDDTEANWDKLSDAEGLNAFRDVRRVLNNYWIDAADEAAKKAGTPELSARIKDLTQKYAHVSFADDFARDAVLSRETNRTLSLSDYVAGSGGSGVGALVGTAVAPVIGTAVGGALGSAAGAVTNKLMRERGNMILGGLADRLSKSAVKVQQRMHSASKLKALLAPARQSTTVPGASAAPARAADVAKELEHAEQLQDPDSEAFQNLGASTQGLELEFGPELPAAIKQKALERANFLLDKAGPRPSPSVFNGSPKRVLSDDAKATLARYLEAADNPTNAIERMADGRGTAEDRETLEALYPQMLGEFREKATASIADRKLDVPYDQQLRVSSALGVPLTSEQQPEALSFWQGFSGAQASMKTPKSNNVKLNSDGARSKADRIG